MPKGHTTRGEARLLGRIRDKPKQLYSREEAVELWYSVRQGVKKRFPHRFWKDSDHRKYVVQAFVDGHLARTGFYPAEEEWKAAKLTGIFMHRLYYKGNLMAPLNEGGYTDKESKKFDPRLVNAPWTVMHNVPCEYWKNADNRVKAVRWLVDACRERHGKKYPGCEDFNDNRLSGLFVHHYDSSPLTALEEAGYTDPTQENFDPVLDFAPWLVLGQMPQSYWHDAENRASATRWLVDIANKEPAEVIADDFKEYGLSGMLQEKSWSPYMALREAGFNVDESDMNELPRGYWKVRKNRVAAVRRFVESSGKKPAEIIADDFDDAGLSGLMKHYKGSPIAALQEAGYRMRALDRPHVPRGTWQSPEHVREALIRVAKAEGKRLEDVTVIDVRRHYKGLLTTHGSFEVALRFAGLDAPEDK